MGPTERLIARARLNRPDPVIADVEVGEPGATPPEESARPSLRIATFNVHAASAVALVRGIASARSVSAADVLLLQEMESSGSERESRVRQVARQLGMHYAYAPAYARYDGGSHGIAVLSRFPLRDVEVIELPRFEVYFNSARRIALGATVAVGGGALRVYSVHLDNRVNPSARLRQLAPVLERAERDTGAVIIGGDLNTTPFHWFANVIPVVWAGQAERLETAVRARGYATPAVGAGATSKWFGMRLDALFTRGLTPLEAVVDRSVRMSDHLPLWVDVRRDGLL